MNINATNAIIRILNKKYAEKPFGEKPIVSTFHFTIFDFLMRSQFYLKLKLLGLLNVAT